MSPQVLSDKTPTARKEHWCNLCSRVIRVGEKYHSQSNLSNGGFYVFKDCAHCRAMWMLCGIEDDGDGVTTESFVDFEPPDIPELRMKVLWLKKWQRADGTLYDVPAEEKR